MVREEGGGEPDEADKVKGREENHSTDHQGHFYLLNYGDCEEDHSQPQQHILDGYRSDIGVLVVEYVKE